MIAGCAAPAELEPTSPGDELPAGDDLLAGDSDAGYGDRIGDALGDPLGDGSGDPAPALPTGCIEGDFRAFRGNVHAHTSYSDGEEDPAAAFAYARDVAGLDVMVVTDHAEQVIWPPPFDLDYLDELTRYDRCLRHASEATEAGTFLAGCGFEYGAAHRADPPGSTGHNNVFFSSQVFGATDLDYHTFFDRLADCGSCIAQFNHPGEEPTQTWDDFTYEPSVADKLRLFEFNGDPAEAWRLLFVALDSGWHVGPVFNQDNHSANWGTSNNNRSGFFMSALDEPALADAMGHARVFASTDVNGEIRLVANDVCWMGSVLSGTESLELVATAFDPDPEGFASIELYGPTGQLLRDESCAGASQCSLSYTLLSSLDVYVLARANYADGGYLISAPIWLSP